jgi:FdhE protein
VAKPEQSIQSLSAVAERDEVARPLALLQVEVLRAASDPAWGTSAEGLGEGHASLDRPLLAGRTIGLGHATIVRLFGRLIDVASDQEIDGARCLGETILSTNGESGDNRPRALLKAALNQDSGTLAQLAQEAGVGIELTATIGHLAASTLLLGIRQHVPNSALPRPWIRGYCPLCAGWPLLAEIRGLERQRWLRCGRCATSWQLRHQQCVYCDNTDHQTLGYLAPEAELESRRAVTCEVCRGYLKTFATVSPLSTADVLARDMTSLELDLAALERGYRRPDEPGYQLDVKLAPSEKRGWTRRLFG